MKIFKQRVWRIIICAGGLALLAAITCIMKLTSVANYQPDGGTGMSLIEKMTVRDEYTLYYHFFPDEDRDVLEQMTCHSGETKEAFDCKITLQDYIYDGKNLYALFVIEQNDGETGILEQFGLNETLMGEHYNYTVMNGFDNWGVSSYNGKYIDNNIYKGKKYLFYSCTNMDDTDLFDGHEEMMDTLYVMDIREVDNSGSDRMFESINNNSVCQFDLDITAKKFETENQGTYLSVTPFGMSYRMGWRISPDKVEICYDDGKTATIYVSGDENTDIKMTKTDYRTGEHTQMFYSFCDYQKFENVRCIRITWSDGTIEEAE